MAEEEMVEPTNPNPGTAQETETPGTQPDVEDLKAFMGEAFKEGLTLADVSAFLKGKKYADLNSGNYVGKRKYDDLEKKHNDYLELTKDYESLKAENQSYKEAARKAELKKQAAAAKIDEQFIDYALSQIDPNEEDTEKAFKEWIKKNPQFKVEEKVVYVETSPNHEKGNRPFKSINDIVNGNLRKAAGKAEN